MAVVEKSLVKLEAAALTDCGQRRKLNEDAVFQRTVQIDTGESIGLYIVCDGLGGHQAGDVASRLAVETAANELDHIFSLSNPADCPQNFLFQQIEAAIKKANAAIRDYAEADSEQVFCPGTTMTLALIYNDWVYIANVGDSRAYIWRSEQITQITQDHSLVAQMARLGIIDEAEIWGHPKSNILSRAVGVDEQVNIDLFEWELQPGDKLLLCSDGLWKAFPDVERLARLFTVFRMSAMDLCELLVSEAKWRDGSDNISAVVVDVDEAAKTKVLGSARLNLHEAALVT